MQGAPPEWVRSALAAGRQIANPCCDQTGLKTWSRGNAPEFLGVRVRIQDAHPVGRNLPGIEGWLGREHRLCGRVNRHEEIDDRPYPQRKAPARWEDHRDGGLHGVIAGQHAQKPALRKVLRDQPFRNTCDSLARQRSQMHGRRVVRTETASHSNGCLTASIA